MNIHVFNVFVTSNVLHIASNFFVGLLASMHPRMSSCYLYECECIPVCLSVCICRLACVCMVGNVCLHDSMRIHTRTYASVHAHL